jgi:hypothetical protein
VPQRDDRKLDHRPVASKLRQGPRRSLDRAGPHTAIAVVLRIQVDFFWPTAQLMDATVFKNEPRSGDQITNRSRHEGFTGWAIAAIRAAM